MVLNSKSKSVWQVNLLSLGLVSFASFLTSLTQGGDRELDAHFNITTCDIASGQIQSSRQVLNEWKRVGRIDLPVKPLVVISKNDGSRRVEQIELSNLELFSVPADKSASR